ncbi:MAG TPA: potassium-transporting ATPase subunit KdpC [Thermoanaerobaculia bacterium]|jgi:K+-transporting ATPase ATPase C chain|nr:potassium-transporting ATPase subunit KdpC [Thermoanaerobaculia bacterium]
MNANVSNGWKAQIVPAVLMTLVLTLILGIAYPLVVTGLARLIFPKQAEGSLIRDAHGTVIGSRLIGQPFSGPGYFRSRPSAAGAGYDGTASGGTNLGPTSKKLIEERVSPAVAAALAENPGAPDRPARKVPVDLVTSSASGLDPHITPAAAEFQVARVAHERRLPEDQVRHLVAAHTEGRQLGFLGEPRVNVLELNLALDGKK